MVSSIELKIMELKIIKSNIKLVFLFNCCYKIFLVLCLYSWFYRYGIVNIKEGVVVFVFV